MLRDIERLINRSIPKQVLTGYEPSGRADPVDDTSPRNGRRGGHRHQQTRRENTTSKPRGRKGDSDRRGNQPQSRGRKTPANHKSSAKPGYSSLADRFMGSD